MNARNIASAVALAHGVGKIEGVVDLLGAKVKKLEEQRAELLAALVRLEMQGWLRHLEDQAESVDPHPVASDILSTVEQCRRAMRNATS